MFQRLQLDEIVQYKQQQQQQQQQQRRRRSRLLIYVFPFWLEENSEASNSKKLKS